MSAYPAIADHGMVGDLQTAALVSSDGTIDWWCTPRFDSPSVFASLLDSERGGYCRLAAHLPGGQEPVVRQLYLSDTAVLVTRFMAPGGVGEVADFMTPLTTGTPTDRHRLVRVVRGSMDFRLTCRPRFDYGRASHALERTGEAAAVFHGPGTDLHLQVTGPFVLHPASRACAQRAVSAGRDEQLDRAERGGTDG
ncbi:MULTISPECIES: trehalase-like domain-containing protein [unclassified Kitasatospora]|uniref:trehalase-like domain-containing protein n=1 Tax=unclassified Kitasatospora TaxID=2633591 RepID=UPI000710C808|nr:hypothetical protein ASC99_29460 [Kitasatospora sp. Root107]KRB65073.1 hypothetical protein ASE03_32330 [Kitasatospora sp. Root187]